MRQETGGWTGIRSFVRRGAWLHDAELSLRRAQGAVLVTFQRLRQALTGFPAARSARQAGRARLARLLRHGPDSRTAAMILIAASLTAFVAAVFLPDPADGTGRTETALSVRAEEAPAPAPIVVPPVAAPPLAIPPVVHPPLPDQPLRLAPAPEAWQPVRRPIAIYHLESAETERLGFRLAVEARGRHDRRDTLTWSARGEAGAEAGRAVIQIAIERFEAGSPTARPLFPDLAQRMAGEGYSIERMNVPGQIATKFGAIEIADAIIDLGPARAACLLFRRIDGIGLTIAGWYCGTPRRPVDRVSLGCLLDRLDLIGAGRDVDLKRLFAAAERNRTGCGQGRFGARKQTWLDHEAPVPALRASARGH